VHGDVEPGIDQDVARGVEPHLRAHASAAPLNPGRRRYRRPPAEATSPDLHGDGELYWGHGHLPRIRELLAAGAA
jgi:hypothetical protein